MKCKYLIRQGYLTLIRGGEKNRPGEQRVIERSSRLFNSGGREWYRSMPPPEATWDICNRCGVLPHILGTREIVELRAM